MAYSNIDKGSKYFTAKTYTANASTQNITGLEFQPDFVWTKSRANAYNHNNYDAVRGATKNIGTNQTRAESTDANSLTSFNSDGFTLGYNEDSNYTNGSTAVSWCWKANGAGVSNTSGTISSTVSANTTSGFSIVSYTGNGTSGATIGHGLGVTPKMFIIKARGASVNWRVYHSSIGNTAGLALNTTGGSDTNSGFFNNTSPTSTVFTVGDGSTVNTSSGTYIAYCFAEVKGFSKFGSYTGNGSTDGTFVYTGFKPAFVMTKSSSTGGTYYDWGMMDNKRANPFNVIDAQVCANLSDEENSANIGSQKIDFLSNGFKPRVNGSSHNGSGVTYIYMAFAESPFVSSKGLPTTAR